MVRAWNECGQKLQMLLYIKLILTDLLALLKKQSQVF